MGSARKSPHSRSRSRTTHSTAATASASRCTIRVRRPDAGVVYHLVFEGSLRKLTAPALHRHLAAVSDVPVALQTLFTEEGRRVRPEDDGNTLGLADGSTLTLQLPDDYLHRSHQTVDHSHHSSHSYRRGNPMYAADTTGDDDNDGESKGPESSEAAWRQRRAPSPAHAEDFSGGSRGGVSADGYSDGYGRGNGATTFPAARHAYQLDPTTGPSASLYAQSRPHPSGPYGGLSRGSPHSDPGGTHPYSGTGDVGRRQDDSYEEGLDGAVDWSASSYAALHRTPPPPPPPPPPAAQRGGMNDHTPASARSGLYAGGGGGGGGGVAHSSTGPYGRRPSQQLSGYPGTASSGSSTVPSPADERDVRQDFSRIASSPRWPLHESREGPMGLGGFNSTSYGSDPDYLGYQGRARTSVVPTTASQRPHQRHKTRRSHRREHPTPTDSKEDTEEARTRERHRGRLVVAPVSPFEAPPDMRSESFYQDPDMPGLRPPVSSVLAGVTPEEQARMTADELAELLAEREYVWQMEQQRFHTERAQHARELQRRERELLFEEQALARQQAALAQETERERRRLASLQAARGEVSLIASDEAAFYEHHHRNAHDTDQPRLILDGNPRERLSSLQAGGRNGRNGETDEDREDSSQAGTHTDLNERNNYRRGTDERPLQAAHSHPRVASAATSTHGDFVADATATPARLQPQWRPPHPSPTTGRGRGIQVLGTTHTTSDATVLSTGHRQDYPSLSLSPGGGGGTDSSPLPRPFRALSRPPMSLLYSNAEEQAARW